MGESWCTWIADRAPAYLQGRQSDVKTLRHALAKDDFAMIQKIAHDMKGTGAAYGFREITELGSQLEMAAKVANRQELDQCLAVLSDYLLQEHSLRSPELSPKRKEGGNGEPRS